MVEKLNKDVLVELLRQADREFYLRPGQAKISYEDHLGATAGYIVRNYNREAKKASTNIRQAPYDLKVTPNGLRAVRKLVQPLKARPNEVRKRGHPPGKSAGDIARDHFAEQMEHDE